MFCENRKRKFLKEAECNSNYPHRILTERNGHASGRSNMRKGLLFMKRSFNMDWCRDFDPFSITLCNLESIREPILKDIKYIYMYTKT